VTCVNLAAVTPVQHGSLSKITPRVSVEIVMYHLVQLTGLHVLKQLRDVQLLRRNMHSLSSHVLRSD
jgi:hypothetical protein